MSKSEIEEEIYLIDTLIRENSDERLKAVGRAEMNRSDNRNENLDAKPVQNHQPQTTLF